MTKLCEDSNTGLIQNYVVVNCALDIFISCAHVEVPPVGVPFFGDACFLKVNFHPLFHSGLPLSSPTPALPYPSQRLPVAQPIPLRFYKDM